METVYQKPNSFKRGPDLHTKRTSHRPFVIVGLFALIILLGYSAVSALYKRSYAANERDHAQREFETVTQDKQDLSQRIDDLQTPFGKEQVLRDVYHAGQSGEGLVVIEKNDATNLTPTHPLTRTLWSRIRDLFK